MRTWIHTNDPKFPFQVKHDISVVVLHLITRSQKKPGEYDETALHSLDYILDEARRYGIRVVLSFVDNWKYYNGVDQYIDWSETAPKRTMERPRDKEGDPFPLDFENEEIKRYETERHALFFTDPGCREMYKNHIRKIVNRKNTANGARYKNDPTIMAWDLINEPRCETTAVPECGDHLQVCTRVVLSAARNMCCVTAVVGRDVFVPSLRRSKSLDHHWFRWFLSKRFRICGTQSTRMGRLSRTGLDAESCHKGHRLCHHPRMAKQLEQVCCSLEPMFCYPTRSRHCSVRTGRVSLFRRTGLEYTLRQQRSFRSHCSWKNSAGK